MCSGTLLNACKDTYLSRSASLQGDCCLLERLRFSLVIASRYVASYNMYALDPSREKSHSSFSRSPVTSEKSYGSLSGFTLPAHQPCSVEAVVQFPSVHQPARQWNVRACRAGSVLASHTAPLSSRTRRGEPRSQQFALLRVRPERVETVAQSAPQGHDHSARLS